MYNVVFFSNKRERFAEFLPIAGIRLEMKRSYKHVGMEVVISISVSLYSTYSALHSRQVNTAVAQSVHNHAPWIFYGTVWTLYMCSVGRGFYLTLVYNMFHHTYYIQDFTMVSL